MSLKKRLAASAAVIAMAAGVIYGSTLEMSGASAEGGRLSWFGNKETLYFWYTDDSMTSFINSAAVSFGEKEGVRVIPMLTSDSEYLEAVNEASLYSKQIPDVYVISHDALEKAYLAGLAVPVEDEQNICNESYFPPSALAAVSYQGKTVAYPFFYETSALVINMDYLEQWALQQAKRELTGADVDAGEGAQEISQEAVEALDQTVLAQKTQEYLEAGIPQTVDEILSIADTFDVPEGVEGIMKWDVSDIFYNYWIVGNYMIVGGETGDDAGNININNEEAISCLEVYKALNQFFYIESDTVTYDSVIQDFIDGKTVFTIGTTDVAERLEEARAEGSLGFEYGIVPMPDVSGELKSRSLSVTNVVAINGYSQHKELANRFAAYLVDEYANELYERTGKVSANLTVNEDNTALQAFMEEYAESMPLPKMMETGNFWMQLEILFSKVWNGEDVAALVQQLADQITSQMSAG